VYTIVVTSNQLKRWLAEQGCTFKERKKHTFAYFGSRFAPIPRHGSKALKTGTVNGILKQLGIKGKPE